MKAGLIVVIGVIVFITPALLRCEALFFTPARKLHTDGWTGSRRKYPPTVAFSATPENYLLACRVVGRAGRVSYVIMPAFVPRPRDYGATLFRKQRKSGG